ncbi:PREDICTED: ankyrin repeat domain-containing protein 62 [Myotis davidii]|nr:PREDICTED: ankyrin repeat domain-containing protein 62 [Myotis davidii]
MNPKVENTTRTQVMALKTVRRNKVSDSDEKEKRLLYENHMLKDEIAKLTLELDTVKNQNQEKYFEDIMIVKEKNDHFQKTITETLFQHNAQLEVLRAELTMLTLNWRINNKTEEDWKQKVNHTGLDGLLLYRIMSIVRHQKEIYKLISRKKKNGFVPRTKINLICLI